MKASYGPVLADKIIEKGNPPVLSPARKKIAAFSNAAHISHLVLSFSNQSLISWSSFLFPLFFLLLLTIPSSLLLLSCCFSLPFQLLIGQLSLFVNLFHHYPFSHFCFYRLFISYPRDFFLHSIPFYSFFCIRNFSLRIDTSSVKYLLNSFFILTSLQKIMMSQKEYAPFQSPHFHTTSSVGRLHRNFVLLTKKK